jgi:hypothetical protein
MTANRAHRPAASLFSLGLFLERHTHHLFRHAEPSPCTWLVQLIAEHLFALLFFCVIKLKRGQKAKAISDMQTLAFVDSYKEIRLLLVCQGEIY